MKKIIQCLTLTLLLNGCGTDNDTKTDKTLSANNVTPVKLTSFNKINDLKNNLSQNGIGSLGQWKYL